MSMLSIDISQIAIPTSQCSGGSSIKWGEYPSSTPQYPPHSQRNAADYLLSIAVVVYESLSVAFTSTRAIQTIRAGEGSVGGAGPSLITVLLQQGMSIHRLNDANNV
jgi:hypothetical protein